MVDIFNILNKSKAEKNKPESGDPKVKPETPAPKLQETQKPVRADIGAILASRANEVREKHITADADNLYRDTVDTLKQIYKTPFEYNADLTLKLDALVKRIINCLIADKKGLLRLCFSDYPQDTIYLHYHAANVCILSLEIGIGMGLEQPRLTNLGVGALLHDIGLLETPEVINKPEILADPEHLIIKDHPRAGAEILKKLSVEIHPDVLAIVEQEHERLDGSGYPSALKGASLNESAQIVGLMDEYELMIHKVATPNKFTPLEAIKKILSNKKAFDTRIIKTLLQRIGIFPIGTVVRLNTKEIGVVIDNDPDSPLGPIVNVIFDAAAREIKPPTQINLAANSVIYVEDCINT